MVTLRFYHAGSYLGDLRVTAGENPERSGELGWLDFNFRPPSQRLGRPVSFFEDSEEWARSLPAAYAGSELQVQILADIPNPEPEPEPAHPSAVVATQPSLWQRYRKWGLVLALAGAGAFAFVFFGRYSPARLENPAPAAAPAKVSSPGAAKSLLVRADAEIFRHHAEADGALAVKALNRHGIAADSGSGRPNQVHVIRADKRKLVLTFESGKRRFRLSHRRGKALVLTRVR